MSFTDFAAAHGVLTLNAFNVARGHQFPAVYRIVNSVSGHYYVGSTKGFQKRLWTHVNALRKGKHHCIGLQRAFKKYGESCFYVEIHTLCQSGDEALTGEQQLLNEAESGHCYNSTREVIRLLQTPEIKKRSLEARMSSPLFQAHLVKFSAAQKTAEARARIKASCAASAVYLENVKAQGRRMRETLSKRARAVYAATGKAQTFASYSAAAVAVGCSVSTVSKRLRLSDKTPVNGFVLERE